MPNRRGDAPSELILEAIKKVLASRTFSTAPNLIKLLRFCVEETVAGRRQTQARIANALGYREFDALQDSNVRREIGRLRVKLRDYYDQEGADDPLVISVPKASAKDGYSAEFRVRQPIATESQDSRYLQLSCEARHLLNERTPETIIQAIRLFQEAVQDDPERSGSAQAGLSQCYAFLVLWGFPAHHTMPKAKESALKAITLDPANAASYGVLAFVTSAYEWDWQRGNQLFQKALTLAPQSIEVRCWYASHLIAIGKFSEAVKQARRAQILEHDPTAVVLSHIGKILYVAGDLDHAFDLLHFTVQMNAQFYLGHWYLGLVLLDRGDRAIGLQHLQKAAELAPANSSVLASLGYASAVMGQVQDCFGFLAKLKTMGETRYVPSTDLATIHAGLGDFNAAFTALEQAFAEKCLYLSWLRAWPPYRHLQNDPRCIEMVRRIGLADDNVRLRVERRPER